MDPIIKVETNPGALALAVPGWARGGNQARARLEESRTARDGAKGADMAFWARPRPAAVPS